MQNIDVILENIHKQDLKIARKFAEFCDNNNLKYYIIGGTFLGAIRHKGFIPWDDDMDIAMPREDYEKMLNLFPNENSEYKLLNYKIDENYKYYITRICNPEYIVIEKSGNRSNLFIDIFPIDGMPSNKYIRKIHCMRILYHRMKLSFYYNDTIDMNAKRKLYEKILIRFAKTIPFNKIINPTKEKEKIDKLLKKHSFYNCKYSGTIMGAYREREIVPTCFFGTPQKYDFEKEKLYGPEKFDDYLTHIYGDYMKIPKKEDRRTHCKEIIKLGDDKI